MSVEIGTVIVADENLSTWKIIWPTAAFSTTDPTQNGLGLSSAVYSERPVSHGLGGDERLGRLE
jgi:hypothetical protein